MSAIHLIKKTTGGLPPIVRVPGESDTYTSGFWNIAEEKALAIIGGKIYFHDKQLAPSFFGGTILHARKVTEDPHAGKILFKFIFSQDCKGIRTDQEGWSQEMKIVM